MKRILSAIFVILILLTSANLPVRAASSKTVACEKHSGKISIDKASLKETGSVSQVCKSCGEVIVSSKLYKIDYAILSQDVFIYDGKAKKPDVYIFDKSGLILTEDKDYTVKYAKGRKNCGKYKVTIKFKGNYKGKKTLYFSIKPSPTEFKSTTVASKTSVKLKWEKVKKGVTGYQIQLSTSSKFKKGTVKTVKVKGYKNTSKTIKSLKKNKTYYIRIRTYNTKNKKTTYSPWSATTKLKLSKVNYSVKKLINTEKLKPLKTNHKELDKLVSKIFKKIHKSDMTTYEKVKACYDYLVKKMEYQTPFLFLTGGNYLSFYDSIIVENAYYALSTKTGVCDNYSAAFVVMCRRLGLEAYVVGGTVSKKDGGRTGHAWAYVMLNGTKYIFDPQVQSNNKNIPYYYFGKTYSQMGSTYELSTDYYNELAFCNFECYSGETSKNDISCSIVATGKNNSVECTVTQNGTSMTLYAANQFETPVKAYGNKFVKIKGNISGGSGKYEVLLVNTATNEIIYDLVTKKSFTWHIDLSKFKSKTNDFKIIVYNYNDYSTYAAIEGIKFKR